MGLLLNGALMNDLSLLTTTLQQQNLALLFLLYIYVLLAALTLMNMLVGVTCEVMSAVAESEREGILLDHVHETIQKLVSKNDADMDGDDRISKEEFLRLLREREARQILSEVGVDVMSLLDLADTIFDIDTDDSGPNSLTMSERVMGHVKIDFSQFMQVILNLRHTNQASFKDIVELRKFMKGQFAQLDHKVRELETAHRRSLRNSVRSQNTQDSLVPGRGASHRRRSRSRSVSPEGVVPGRNTQGRPPSPSSILAAELREASHLHSVHEEFALEEAAQDLQRRVTESLDNLFAVYQCKMAAYEAQTVHGQQQQQDQDQDQEQDQRRRMLKPQGSDCLQGNGTQWHQELEETSPGSEAVTVISTPRTCNAKDKPSSAGSISRKSADAPPGNRQALECQSLPGIYRS